MPEIKIHVPTYYCDAGAVDYLGRQRREFDDPRVPVIVRDADGVRIVLGSNDYWNANAPDVQIERRPNGWAIFLHPMGGGDPAGYLYFLDDGRSFLVPEKPTSSTPPTIQLDYEDAVAEVDRTPE